MIRSPESFTVAIEPEKLDRIRRRVAQYRLDGFPRLPGWRLGMPMEQVERLREYWLDSFSWPEAERSINRFPQFRCTVRGEPLHFLKVNGRGEGERQALVLIHGWPGSFYEFYDLLDQLLSDPTWGYDIVVPSLPGFAFSTPLSAPIGCREIGGRIHELMTDVLGYQSYVAQGGDWGSVIASWLGFDHSESCRGVYLSTDGLRPYAAAQQRVEYSSEDWTKEELAHFAMERTALQDEMGYYRIQATRPQTLGIAMHDNPLGTAAWIFEMYHRWSNLGDQGDLGELLGWDRLLTIATPYLSEDAFITSTWIYVGHELDDPPTLPPGRRVEVPTAFAAYRDPVDPAPPRTLVERSHNLIKWTEMPRGGHFAALEEPGLFAGDLRDFLHLLDPEATSSEPPRLRP